MDASKWKCTKCGGDGPFGRDLKAKSGLKSWCRKCLAVKQADYRRRNPDAWSKWAARNSTYLKARDKARYARDPEGEKERVRRYREANPDKVAQWEAKSKLAKYGITPEQKQEMHDAQGGLCSICHDPLKTGKTGAQVDHDHASGRVRGLVCHPCNRMLGSFKEERQRFEAAVRYLQQGVLENIPYRQRPEDASRTGTRSSNLWYSLHMTERSVQWLRQKQGGLCAICGDTLPESPLMHIDHDPTLGRRAVRGLLCRDCNWGLGQARDRIDVLKASVVYLGLV